MTREDWNDIANGRGGMTEQEHADLSRRLALALGYYPESVRVPFGMICEVFREDAIGNEADWRGFDYRQPDVALPVLKAFGVSNALNVWASGPEWWNWSTAEGFDGVCATLEEAIARAACAVKGIK